MPQQVAKLIEKQQLTSIKPSTRIRDAINSMVENDFSQLPVLDDSNKPVGMFTERKLMTLCDMSALDDVLDLPVAGFLELSPVSVPPDHGIYEVAKLLGRGDLGAVLVVESGEAKGIVTDFDIAGFLAAWSEGIALLEDIEKRLRACIEEVYKAPTSRDAAIFRAIGHDKSEPTKPAKQYDELTLHEYEQLMTYKEHWPKFQPLLESKRLFVTFMANVKPIRNQVAHFRGDLTQAQLKKLREVANWLLHRQIAWTQDTKARKALEEELLQMFDGMTGEAIRQLLGVEPSPKSDDIPF